MFKTVQTQHLLITSTVLWTQGVFFLKWKFIKAEFNLSISVYIVKPTFFNTMVTENFHLHNMRTLVSNCYVTKLWHTHFILPNSLNIFLHSLSYHWCIAITDADYHSLIPNLHPFLPVQSSGALITGNTLLLLVLIPLLAQWLEQSRRSKKHLVKQLISIPAVVAFTPALLFSDYPVSRSPVVWSRLVSFFLAGIK